MVVTICLWSIFSPEIQLAAECTNSWPEIAHLAGARLRPQAAGMRSLVSLVREATPGTGDEVLLLPEDPHVEAWFERPRPHLTSAITFVDQYWDRYVDEDFRRLEARPPKVIVIGPRGFIVGFDSLWGQRGHGVDRLITRVRTELIPGKYRRAREHGIVFRGRPEVMDVYVRLDDGSEPDRRCAAPRPRCCRPRHRR